MQTNIQKTILQTPIGQEANDILRSCVHCGFCTATCPTYQILGDELDSPRGRIYLIKRVLETNKVSENTQLHLDRCLSCGACETTCPSGVKYRRLLDIGREIVEEKVGRPQLTKIVRQILDKTLSNPPLFSALLRCGQLVRPLMPKILKQKIPKRQKIQQLTLNTHARKMILFRGCVHDAIAPEINHNAIQVLDKLGVSVLEMKALSCCGAVSHHLSQKEKTENVVKQNIDTLLDLLEAGVEQIFTTASACSLMLKDYPTLMADDEIYQSKALKISEKVKDISEIICNESFEHLSFQKSQQKIAFHNPCSLQHGLKITGQVEALLSKAGYALTPVIDAHLCCGSSGTYSILQKTLSDQLLNNKVKNLMAQQPTLIATANVGCLHHIQSASKVPVKHWISLINQSLN